MFGRLQYYGGQISGGFSQYKHALQASVGRLIYDDSCAGEEEEVVSEEDRITAEEIRKKLETIVKERKERLNKYIEVDQCCERLEQIASLFDSDTDSEDKKDIWFEYTTSDLSVKDIMKKAVQVMKQPSSLDDVEVSVDITFKDVSLADTFLISEEYEPILKGMVTLIEKAIEGLENGDALAKKMLDEGDIREMIHIISVIELRRVENVKI